MHLLEQKLKDEYLVISTSFEGIGDKIFNDEEIFSREILDIFADSLEFKEFIEKIILLGQEIVYVPSDPLISMGEMYGFLRRVDNVCKIHNRIFEQYILFRKDVNI